MAPRLPQKPLRHHRSTLQLTEEQRLELDKMEHWHFLSVQIWTHDVGNFVTALFEILVFILAMFSMDITRNTPDWILKFGFECLKGHKSRWWIEQSSSSGTLWELHIIIVFMYTTLAIVVLSTIPYKYDRLVKSEKEIESEKKKEDKKEKKKQRKKYRSSRRLSMAKPDFELET